MNAMKPTPSALAMVPFVSVDDMMRLVNAIGRELCFDDYALPVEHAITSEDVDNAAEILRDGMEIRLGKTHLVFRELSDEGSTATATAT